MDESTLPVRMTGFSIVNFSFELRNLRSAPTHTHTYESPNGRYSSFH